MASEPTSKQSQKSTSKENIEKTDLKTEFCCPVCENENLSVGTISKIQVCFCDSCDGFVLPQKDFQDLVNHLRATYPGPEDRPVPIDQLELHQKRNCPACLQPMDTHPYYGPGNIVIDSCYFCALVWLDESELTTIQKAPGRRPLY